MSGPVTARTVHKTTLHQLLDEAPAEQLPPATNRNSHFFTLPAEVRNQIYGYFILSNATLYSAPIHIGDGWHKYAFSSKFALDGHGDPICRERLVVGSELFLVNKQISLETQSLIYLENTFAFHFVQAGHAYPFESITPFGIFELRNQHKLLSNIRTMYLTGRLDGWPPSLREEMSHVVSVLVDLKENGQGRLLENITIEFPKSEEFGGKPRGEFKFGQNMALFAIDDLARLTGMKKVEVLGMPEWYSKCLQLCMKSDTVIVKEAAWKLKRNTNRYGKVYIKSEKNWFPKYNWKEFAEAHSITIEPEYEWLRWIKSRP